MHLFYINRNHTCSLRSIDDQKQPMPPCKLSHPLHVRQVSGQIRCMGADDRFRVCPDGCFDRIKICRSVLSTRRNRKFNTLFLHGIERTQHRIMLQLRRDHMLSRKKHPLDCHIQSFRCIGRKNQPRWITASEKIAERPSRLIDHSRCSKCRTGKSPPGISQSFHGIKNGIINCLRFLKRCRCVVQINHAVILTLSLKHIASSFLQQMDFSAIHKDFCNFFRYRRHFFFR